MRCLPISFSCHVLWATTWLATVLLSISPTAAREWTDNTGNFHRQGEFVRREGNVVWLESKAGFPISVKWDRLSAADQAHITAELAQLKPPTSKPAASLPIAQAGQAIFRLANFQPKSLTVDESDEQNYDTEGEKKWIRKYIYSGCYNTFHLVGAWGTAAYSWNCHHYLAFLIRDFQKETTHHDYFYYYPWFGDSDTTEWALQRWPTDPCGRYAVFRSDGKHWHFFCYCYRERPR